MIDSGAGCSLLTKGTLKNVSGVDLRPADRVLVDASQNTIRLLGMTTIPIQIEGDSKQLISKDVTFYVSESEASCVLLGRNFMRSFGKVSFDFDRNRVQLGSTWCSGLKMSGGRVKIAEETVLPPNCEAYVKVKWRQGNGMVMGDFVPCSISPNAGVYAIRARVVPNSSGEFFTVVVNTTGEEVRLKKSARLGKLTACAETVAVVDSEILGSLLLLPLAGC
jgi:hypothetical protein